MGYGARVLQALNTYYSSEYLNLDEYVKADALRPDTVKINEVCRSLSHQLTRSLPLISPPVFSLTNV
jgi:hypothetical protein